MNPQRIRWATWALIAGLAIVFGWFGLDKFVQPAFWIGWMPPWLDGMLGLSRDTWLQVTGVIEMTLAVMVLVPVRRARQAGAAVMALHLVAVLSQTGWNDIGVRDTGLLLGSVALWLLL